MDLAQFRTQYQACSEGSDRTALLLAFAEDAMQSCPDELGPLLSVHRTEASSSGRPSDSAYCSRLLGWLAVDRADYASALSFFEEAEETFVASGDQAGRLKALNGIGSVQLALGSYESALQVYRTALALAGELGDQDQELVVRANLGEALLNLNQHSEAEEFLREALDSGRLNPLNRSLVLNQLARAALPQGKRDQASAAVEESVRLARAGGFLPALSSALDLRGLTELSRGEGDRAEASLREARAVAVQAGERAAAVQASVDLGWLELNRGRTDEASELFAEAGSQAESLGARPLEAEALRGLARAFRDRRLWQEAFEAQERHHELLESLHDENTTRQVAQIRSDQARKEAELYRNQLDVLTKLGNLGQRISACLNVEAIALAVYGTIGDLMRADGFGLGLYDEARKVIAYQLFIEEGRRIAPFEAPLGELSFSGWCLRHRSEVLMGDADLEYRRYLPHQPPVIDTNGRRTRSCLYVPLIADDQVLGVLSAQSYQVGAYGDRDLATLRSLAASIAIAVQNARLFDRITVLATVDSLTGASTRRHLFDRTEQEYQRLLRDGTPLALVMIDLDHFKALNDSWGHSTGDQVLAEFGRLCLEHKRPHDLFGRYGGEEFALVLAGTGLDGARRSAQRLCDAVRDLKLTAPGGEAIRLTASFGVTEFTAQDGVVTRVFSRADEALYEAKQSGRDRVIVRTW